MFRYDLKTGVLDKFSGIDMIDASAFSSDGSKVVAFGDFHDGTSLYVFTAMVISSGVCSHIIS